MFSRHTYLVLGLLVAGGAPYLSSQEELKNSVSSWMPTQQATDESESVFKLASAESDSIVSPPSANPFGGSTVATNTSTASTSPSEASTTTTPAADGANLPTVRNVGTTRVVSTTPPSLAAKQEPVDGSKPIRFEEVFRLDVNSAWLMARWPRVTTGLADLDLHGYRVPLVTGKREDDLAGALTYYYDKNQVIQKMTFRGVTGDPRRLVHFGTSQCELEREIVDDPAMQVYRTKGVGKKASELTVRPAKVIRADAPRERYEVEFVLKR